MGGYQCEFCNTIYKELKAAANCESIPMEKPLLEIGDTLIDDQYDKETEIRVCKISYEGHEVNYRMEWQHGFDDKWEEAHSIYGNEMLKESFDILITKQ